MRLVTLFFLLLFFTYLSNSQEITQVVRGQVTDADMGYDMIMGMDLLRELKIDILSSTLRGFECPRVASILA